MQCLTSPRVQSTRSRGCQACGRALVPNQLGGIEYESCAAAHCIAHQFLEPRDAEDSASHIVEGEIDDSTLPQGATGEAPQIRRCQSRGNSQPLASAQQLHRNRTSLCKLECGSERESATIVERARVPLRTCRDESLQSSGNRFVMDIYSASRAYMLITSERPYKQSIP